MAVQKKTHTIKCPTCKEQIVVQVWSCGCLLVPPNAKHCGGTRSFADEQSLNCGERGHPKEHRSGPSHATPAVHVVEN